MVLRTWEPTCVPNNRINLSKDFLEQVTSANIDNEIVTSGIAPEELDQVSQDVANAVLAEQKEKANDAIQLFATRINKPRFR